ncbi:MAG: molybdopterin-dependent oxidoreductase, partial [Nitrososphaerales archaeon]
MPDVYMSVKIGRRSLLKTLATIGAAAAFSSLVSQKLFKAITPADAQTTEEKEVISYSAGNGGPLKLVVKGGVLRRVEVFDPNVRASQRERANRKALYSPARVRYPLKRVGFVPGGKSPTDNRGKGEFVRISWDEALEIVASELKRIKETYGNSAIYAGADWATVFPSFHHIYNLLYRFFHLFGGRTEYRTFYSNAAINVAWPYSLGSDLTYNDPEDILENTKLILFLWTDPAVTSTHRNDNHNNLWLKKCKEKGIRMIHVNPKFTDSMAAYGDKWIPIIPGTDCALLAAMAYVMIQENLYDKEFIAKYTVGFEKFADYILGREDGVPKTPEWAAPICGIDAATIRELAREVATTKPAVIWQGWGAQRAAYGEQPVRMAITIAAMTGNIGIPGGCVVQGPNNSNSLRRVETMVGSLPVPPNPVKTFFPMVLIADALLNPGKPFRWDRGDYVFPDIKAIYWAGFNQLNQQADLNKFIEALKKPEFIVVNEIFLTPTAKFADIVLPAAHQFERNDFLCFYKYLIFMKKAVEPLGEAKSDYEIFTLLAEKLGFKQQYTEGRTEMDWLRYLYSQSKCPLTFEEIMQRGYYVFDKEPTVYIAFKAFRQDPEKNPLKTPTGKIEIYSEL